MITIYKIWHNNEIGWVQEYKENGLKTKPNYPIFSRGCKYQHLVISIFAGMYSVWRILGGFF